MFTDKIHLTDKSNQILTCLTVCLSADVAKQFGFINSNPMCQEFCEYLEYFYKMRGLCFSLALNHSCDKHVFTSL